jgi:hypothetical protein
MVESSWNVMAHGDAREGKWRGNWRMQWIASTLHTTSEHGVSSITTADPHTSAASSRLNWRHRRFKWTRPFGRKTKSGFCACAITFQTQSTNVPTFQGNHCLHLRDAHSWYCSSTHENALTFAVLAPTEFRRLCGFCHQQSHSSLKNSLGIKCICVFCLRINTGMFCCATGYSCAYIWM